MNSEWLENSLTDAIKTLRDFTENESNVKNIAEVSNVLAQCFARGGKALICGNGGSACDSMHFAEEFTGRYRKNRKPLPVISLSDSSHITCVGNDYGFEEIFSRGVEAYGTKGDVFVGLSTSGNSPNIVRAHETAIKTGMKTILLLGKGGGALSGKADIEFIVKGATSDRIQEVHMTVLHIVIEGVERILFPENYE
ncbi:D-sedoheptulose 7-phosphate isomerase [candidate division WOR-3 bacterium]|nr:D-sedoheptulose 7-phosphate isomerase [candidate division WOR-3 bacterium]